MTVKFSENYSFSITPTTKNETYQYTGDDAGVTFTINNNWSWFPDSSFSPSMRCFNKQQSE